MLNRLADLVRLRTYADTLIQPVARSSPVTPVEFSLFEQVRGQIEAALPDGSFQVAIKNQVFNLRLPVTAHAGDEMQLSVTATDPQLRFAFMAMEDSPALPTRLSDTARFITALLGEAGKLPQTEIQVGSAPLLTQPAATGAVIAPALERALGSSGMFYEAHLAQWTRGERPLQTLLQEPQARLARTAVESATSSRNADAAATTITVLSAASPRLPELPVHRDALAIVRQQLDILDSRSLVWQGVIWPGQVMEWKIDEHDRATAEHPAAQEWKTRLHLILPRLGDVNASLSITPSGVTVVLQAADTETAAAMRGNSADLRQAMQHAGVSVRSITVKSDAAR